MPQRIPKLRSLVFAARQRDQALASGVGDLAEELAFSRECPHTLSESRGPTNLAARTWKPSLGTLPCSSLTSLPPRLESPGRPAPTPGQHRIRLHNWRQPTVLVALLTLAMAAGCGGEDDSDQAAEDFAQAVSSLSAKQDAEEANDAQYAEFTEEARDIQTEVTRRVQETSTSVDRAALRAFLGDAIVSWDLLAAALESDQAVTADEFSEAALAVAELKAALQRG